MEKERGTKQELFGDQKEGAGIRKDGSPAKRMVQKRSRKKN